jgi:Holliday junction resolvasome RuvABC endonuclease subunit
MITIGIDPGKNGGIAVIDEQGHAHADKMPETLQDLFEHFDSLNLSHTGDRRAYIEQVHSSPQMGVKSAFTFGNGFGHLEMALTACGIPFERIRPQAWQKALGCMTKGDKNVSKRRAQELFPTLKITHSTADALLIAEYGRRLK